MKPSFHTLRATHPPKIDSLTLSPTAYRFLRAAIIALACLAIMALAGCATNDDKTATVQSAEVASETDTGEATRTTTSEESTALVLSVSGDTALLIDQESEVPYTITPNADIIVDEDGIIIPISELKAGDIVKITGDGVMTNSYPAQYSNVTKIEVISEGSTDDVTKYATIIEQFSTDTTATVPSGTVNYATSQAQASIMLNAYEYDMTVPTSDTASNRMKLDGDCYDANGLINSDIVDARISESTEATLTFTSLPDEIEVERVALLDGKAQVNTKAKDADVKATLQADGTTTLTIEPGYLYKIDAEFAQGDVHYAFYTLA